MNIPNMTPLEKHLFDLARTSQAEALTVADLLQDIYYSYEDETEAHAQVKATVAELQGVLKGLKKVLA